MDGVAGTFSHRDGHYFHSRNTYFRNVSRLSTPAPLVYSTCSPWG